MADYRIVLTNFPLIIRNADGAVISDVATDPDRIAYNEWLTAGNVPDNPQITEEPASSHLILLDHENRLRSQEGVPPLTQEDFVKKLSG